MHYSYKKLRGRIKELYGSQKKFSDKLGISENAVSNKLSQKTEFSQSDVERWAVLLGIRRVDYGEFFYT